MSRTIMEVTGNPQKNLPTETAICSISVKYDRRLWQFFLHTAPTHPFTLLQSNRWQLSHPQGFCGALVAKYNSKNQGREEQEMTRSMLVRLVILLLTVAMVSGCILVPVDD